MKATVRLSVSSDDLAKRFKKQIQAKVKTAPIMVGVNNSQIATYAQYLEYGWVQRVTPKQAGWFAGVHGVRLPVGTVLTNPPRPFLRDTARAEAKKWGKQFKEGFAQLGTAEKVLPYIGALAQSDVIITLSKGGSSLGKFPDRSPLTLTLAQNNHNPKGSKSYNKTGTLFRKEAGISSGELLRAVSFWMDEG